MPLRIRYKNRLMVGRYPACVLKAEVNPALLDVNVHPTKSEVKFAYEKAVFDAVFLAVKDAVDAGDSKAAIHSRISNVPKFDVSDRSFVQTTMKAQANPGFFGTMDAGKFRSMYASDSRTDYAQVRTPDLTEKKADGNFEPDRTGMTADDAPGIKDGQSMAWTETGMNQNNVQRMQVRKKACPLEGFRRSIRDIYNGRGRGGYPFIDKHAAHERMLFNKLLENRMHLFRNTCSSPRCCSLRGTILRR